jgi:hypothetical protein
LCAATGLESRGITENPKSKNSTVGMNSESGTTVDIDEWSMAGENGLL